MPASQASQHAKRVLWRTMGIDAGAIRELAALFMLILAEETNRHGSLCLTDEDGWRSLTGRLIERSDSLAPLRRFGLDPRCEPMRALDTVLRAVAKDPRSLPPAVGMPRQTEDVERQQRRGLLRGPMDAVDFEEWLFYQHHGPDVAWLELPGREMDESLRPATIFQSPLFLRPWHHQFPPVRLQDITRELVAPGSRAYANRMVSAVANDVAASPQSQEDMALQHLGGLPPPRAGPGADPPSGVPQGPLDPQGRSPEEELFKLFVLGFLSARTWKSTGTGKGFLVPVTRVEYQQYRPTAIPEASVYWEDDLIPTTILEVYNAVWLQLEQDRTRQIHLASLAAVAKHQGVDRYFLLETDMQLQHYLSTIGRAQSVRFLVELVVLDTGEL